MPGTWARIGVAAVAVALAGLPAHAQAPTLGGLPALALPAPQPPAASPSPGFPSVRPGLPPLPTSQPPAAAPATARQSAATAAALAAARLPPIGPTGAVATLELESALKSPGLSASRDALGNVSLKAIAPVAVASPGGYAERAAALLAAHPEALEADDAGRPVVRGRILGVAVSSAALARARAQGFAVLGEETISGLDLATVTLTPPRGLSARDGLRRLRTLDPGGRYDLDHIYVEGGAAAPTSAGSVAVVGPAKPSRGLRIGLVDGAAPADHPALRQARLVQQPFGPGGLRATAHGAAVASLLVGVAPGFRGAAPGATLYVADVYGGAPAGGSALAIARALGWLARQRTPVINISLVGPPNVLLEASVAALVRSGRLVVAAVGNDGPASPPLYPAAYPGVVAVTGVDARRRVLPEAGRGPQVAFAAPAADMLAADLDGGFSEVRGTSYAAPLVAGRLATLLPEPDPQRALRALDALARQAADLGSPGRDPVYGRGLVAFDLAVRPTATRLAGAAR